MVDLARDIEAQLEIDMELVSFMSLSPVELMAVTAPRFDRKTSINSSFSNEESNLRRLSIAVCSLIVSPSRFSYPDFPCTPRRWRCQTRRRDWPPRRTRGVIGDFNIAFTYMKFSITRTVYHRPHFVTPHRPILIRLSVNSSNDGLSGRL
jgi:hypothetical protein